MNRQLRPRELHYRWGIGTQIPGNFEISVPLPSGELERNPRKSLIIVKIFENALSPQEVAKIVEYISISAHLDNLARGVIDSRDVMYYLSLTAGALLLAVRSLSRQHA